MFMDHFALSSHKRKFYNFYSRTGNNSKFGFGSGSRRVGTADSAVLSKQSQKKFLAVQPAIIPSSVSDPEVGGSVPYGSTSTRTVSKKLVLGPDRAGTVAYGSGAQWQ